MALQQHARQLGGSRPSTRPRSAVKAVSAPTTTTVKLAVKSYGSACLQGTVRKVNEDRLAVEKNGDMHFVGVYDGHGGSAVAQWLKDKLFKIVNDEWNPLEPTAAIQKAYLAADKKLLTPGAGFLGLGERGVGGSKCGATAATAIVYQCPRDGTTKLLAANVGDARVVIVRAGPGAEGPAEQLTVDHVPDDAKERKRIERFNPNPKMPLVRYVAGTWRVGGLLALSRAFGDAYMKGSLQFEGIPQGSDNYSSGFGVIAEPHSTVVELPSEPCWVVVSSDGLYSEEERGGGGGLDNNTVAEILRAASPDTDCSVIAAAMAKAAIEVGSTDDVTLVVMRLGPA